METQVLVPREDLVSKLAGLMAPVEELEQGLLASAFYDGDLRLAVLKFYDSKTNRFWLWRDNTGHKPYCYTRMPRAELESIASRKDVIGIEDEERLDLLNDTHVKVRKITTTDPLAIGGGNDSIRDLIRAWEADIKYYENYAYDRSLRMGTYYSVRGGKVVPAKYEVPESVARSLKEILGRNPPEFAPYLNEWAELLGEPLCDFKRIALDIEVANEAGRLPDPEDPRQPIIAVSFFNESEKVVYLLTSGKPTTGFEGAGFRAIPFDDETSLIRAVLSKIMDYPVVVTFNGDDFDLRYLKHRAEAKLISEAENPILLERVAATLKHGVHIDLYQFFRNKSIQVYAFSNKYTEHTLNGVSESLLDKSKLEFEGEIGDLPLVDLAKYCLNDAQLTYELTTMGGSVVMKLLLVISRIGKMPINDVSRLGVSNWIRSMMFYEHRKLGALIPRQDELGEKGGASSQAVIKGKKYKGGLVIDPQPGVFFDVSVLDFASLYPSLIKVHNLSYETVNCPHEECKTNGIPDTASWVCRRRKGITSLVTGSLRDLRVMHYKPLTKNTTLSPEDRELNSVVTQGLKVFLNASYGVYGFETFAFYCLPVAEATAALGRNAITRTIARCKELGVNVLYSDTDSLFLQSPSKEQIAEVKRWSEGSLGVELDLDKTYRYVAFSSRKKNYFGVLPDGKVDIRGLTGKKSVDGSTPMLVRVDGKQILVTVEEAYQYFKNNRQVQVLSVTDALRTVWTPVSDATKHLVTEVYEVVTSRGRTLKLSGDHSLYLMDDFGNLTTKETREVESGDVLVGARYIPPRNGIVSLETAEFLTTKCEVHGNLLYSAKPHSTTGVPIPTRIKVSEDLGTLLGLYVAEGSSSSDPKRRNNVFTQDYLTNSEVCDAIADSWKASFGWDIHVMKRNDSNLSFYLPTLYSEFFKNLCGVDSASKKVPWFLFDCDEAVVRGFLRGYFSGDGYSNGKRINATSSSRGLMIQMAHLLAYFDVDTRLRKQYHRKYGRYYYWLSVVGTSSRERFLAEIGFLQRRFQELPSVGPRNKELLPLKTRGIISIKRSILTRSRKKAIKGLVFHDKRDFNATLLGRYNGVIGLLEELGNESEKAQLNKIKTMLNSQDVSYDEVVTIRKVRGGAEMFDFSVPGLERFVAGNLPTLLHNSQTPEYLKETFYKALDILSRVQTESDFARAKSEAKDLLRGMITDLKGRKVPVEKLAFTVMMGKDTESYNGTTPQHVRAAKLLQDKGKEVKAGEIIAYVKTRNPPYVRPVGQAKPEDVDPDKYIEYAHSMFDQMLDALDFSFEEIMGATTLDLFWSS